MTTADYVRMHEGVRAQAYDDLTGHQIVPGYTCRGNPTIGVGINLLAGLDDEEIAWLYERRLARARSTVTSAVGLSHLPPDPRRTALVDLAYQVGDRGFRGFKGMIAAVRAMRWGAAADEMLMRNPPHDTSPTPYAQRAGTRALMNEEILRTGMMPGAKKEER